MRMKLSAGKPVRLAKQEQNNMSRPQLHKKSKFLRVRRVRARITGTATRPRLTVLRGLKSISAQLIDDVKGSTLCAVSERELSLAEKKGTKTERAERSGLLLAKKAVAKGLSSVVFDRRGNKYHGRVKAFADAARQGGLQF